MSLLKKSAAIGSDVKNTKEQDRLGGTSVKETDVYAATIDSMYMTQAKSGAVGVVLNLNFKDGSKFSETMYITNKNGENTYKNKSTGELELLPGLLMLDSLSQMLIGKPLADNDSEERKLDIYDYESKATRPTAVECLVDFFKKEVQVALVKVRANKQVKGDGGYVDSPDERFFNRIEKFFNADGQTNTEQQAKVPANFINQWLEKNKGKLRDEYKQVAGVQSGAPAQRKPITPPATPAAAGAASSDDDDLFGED
jgi:dipeptidyl aminopeptidase/acylaminoacyl peptidase